MHKDIPKQILAQVPLFAKLPEEQLERLAGLVHRKQVAKKKVLFLKGEAGRSLHLLVTGAVQLYNTTPDGRDVVVKILGPGEIFAEIVLLAEKPYPVNAVALKDSLVYTIDRKEFLDLMDDAPFRNIFIGQLVDRVCYLSRQNLYIASYDVEERLVLYLYEQYGCREEIHVSLSKKEIALAIGTTQETLSRVVKRLSKNEALLWKGKEILIKDSYWREKCDQLDIECSFS